jgi:hypothetical protein
MNMSLGEWLIWINDALPTGMIAAPIADISKGVAFRKFIRIKNIPRNIITFLGMFSSVIFFTVLKSH